METIILPKSLTFLGNFGEGGIIFHFSTEVIYWATFIDIWLLFIGHTEHRLGKAKLHDLRHRMKYG